MNRRDMNVAILCDIEPFSPYVNRRFVETYHLHLAGSKISAYFPLICSGRQARKSNGPMRVVSNPHITRIPAG
jgi:hypothetical protein